MQSRIYSFPFFQLLFTLSKRLDLLSWFYVYLLGFGLHSNLIHHLALYQVSVRTLEWTSTPLPSLISSRIPACGSLHLVVNTCGTVFTVLDVHHARHTRKRRKPHFYDSRLSLHWFTLQCPVAPIFYALRILLELAFKHKSIPWG